MKSNLIRINFSIILLFIIYKNAIALKIKFIRNLSFNKLNTIIHAIHNET